MTGSNTGGDFNAGAIGGRISNCGTLSFETHIHSPIPAELAKLKIGDVLDIAVSRIASTVTLQLLNQGSVVGGLIDRAPAIKRCIEKGFNYTATVRAINGAAVTIFVQPL